MSPDSTALARTVRSSWRAHSRAGRLSAAVLSAGDAPPAPPPRPMTFLDMQQMRNAGVADAEPGRPWMLYTCRRRTGRKPSGRRDIYLVSMTDGRVVDEAADVHDEKNETAPAWTPRRQLVPVPVESRRAGQRGDAEPDLPDADRRRRGAAITDAQGRRRRLRAEPGRQVAGLSGRPRGDAPAVSPADAADVEARRSRAADQAAGRRRHLGAGRRTAAGSTS